MVMNYVVFVHIPKKYEAICNKLITTELASCDREISLTGNDSHTFNDMINAGVIERHQPHHNYQVKFIRKLNDSRH